ncbi:MAG: Spx/MgsR family RNA polymerase-binding regulatory protein [Gammaproteobacteria bacterium]|nr:Spx/MgsR family RNA polymerase-binding regulatory protein [Gammaproteobacteria bacterium]
MILYGIPNCDTCRKARKWLDSEGVAHEFHDVREQPLDRKTLADWERRFGDALVNRRSTTWRQLDESARRMDDIPALLLEHPTLMKRPVLAGRDFALLGFKPGDWQAAIEK